jgi:hypothetical protein
VKQIYLILSAYLTVLLIPSLAAAQPVTIILQPDGLCGKDAIVAGCIPCGYDNTNFGNSEELSAIAWTNSGAISNGRSLMQFDLTSIPTGSVVQSAYLSLYFDPTSSNGQHSSLSGPNDAYLSEISSYWDETTVTWNNQPGTSSTNQVYLPQSISPTQDYLNMDATAMIQDFVNNPAQNYGMMLQLATEQYYRSLIFASSDHPNPALHPKLVVTYTPAITNCISLQYASCNGIDVMPSSCAPCGYDTANFGMTPEIDAIAWTNLGNLSNGRSLLYWDLSFIPANASVTSASLSLYAYNSPSNGEHSSLSGPNDAYLNKVTSPWNEYSVNWNNMPSVSTTNQAYLPPSSSPSQDYTNIDVTTLVQDMITNPASNYGLMLQLADETAYRKLIFASSDNADPAKHPKLDICYTVPSAIDVMQNHAAISVVEDFISETITVTSRENFEKGTMLKLMNSKGQLVRSYENLNGNTLVFSISNIASGIYIYEINNASVLWKRGKVVKD